MSPDGVRSDEASRDGVGPAFRPVGWWLKEADAALDAAFDAALAGEGVDRRVWQVLASLARGPQPAAELVASLASFDAPASLAAVVDDARSRGWVEESGGALRLTAAGVDRHRTLAPLVGAVRGRVSAALPPDDLRRLVALLERLVAGLRS